MRTTLTLDPDVVERLKEEMASGHSTWKETVNRVLRAGLNDRKKVAAKRFRVEPHHCGFKAGIDLDRLNQLVDDLDAESAARKLSR